MYINTDTLNQLNSDISNILIIILLLAASGLRKPYKQHTINYACDTMHYYSNYRKAFQTSQLDDKYTWSLHRSSTLSSATDPVSWRSGSVRSVPGELGPAADPESEPAPRTFSYTCSATLRTWMKSLAIKRSLKNI